MSFASIWSSNLHNLRHTLVSSHNHNLLRFGTCGGWGILDTGRWTFQSLTTKVQIMNQKLENDKPCNIKLELLDGTVKRRSQANVNKSEFQNFQAIQQCDVQQSVTEERDLNQLVTVLVFDIETTGFSRNHDRIIEFALQDLFGGRNSTFQTLVNPERFVPNTDIHGISTNMVNRHDVPRWKELAPILVRYVQSRQKPGGIVLWVAHNGRRFDVPFLIKECSRCSMDIPPDWFFVDTLPLARQLVKPDGSKLSSFSLKSLGEHFGIPLLGEAHRAMSDVNMLSSVLQKMTFELKIPISGLVERSFKVSDLT
ncbi:exonuclease DPD1, chloroplastic/mitochondrial-like [Aristolochia californica]|uniref:exonuclease DPD1, chloroplastic/mitochondrial-like n=1 Tax=Aristolochia californica TaxID=171875 RepID=UPI0035E04460